MALQAGEPVTDTTSGVKRSRLIDTGVIYCGDNLEQLAKLPDACVELIYIDPPFNSNRNYEVFWGETKEKRRFEDTQDSIGNAVFLAGKTRYACQHSTFMYHGVGFDSQPGRLEEKFLRERLDGVLSDQKRIGAVIEERTNLTARQVKPLFREARTKDATFAVGCGIVHEIRDVHIPQGSTVVSLVFKR